MAFSNQRAVSDGSLQTIILSIAFFDKTEIHVYVDDVEKFVDVDFIWATSNSIQFPSNLPVDTTVILRRVTDISEMRHIFTAGAQFTNQTLDEDYTQILHIAQESVEGSYTTELFNDLDMHQYRVRNMAPGVLPGDAVNFAQYTSDKESVGNVVLQTDRFVGVHAVAPDTRRDGSALQVADEYQNSVDGLRYSWNGTVWVALNSSAQQLEERLADPDVGARIITWVRSTITDTEKSLQNALNAQKHNLHEFSDFVVSKPNPMNPATWDWTPAIQLATDHISMIGGGELFAPTGIYQHTTINKKPNVSYSGEGLNVTKYVNTGAGHAFQWLGTTSNRLPSFHMMNMSITGNPGSLDGIHIEWLGRRATAVALLSSVGITEHGRDGVYIEGADAMSYVACEVSRNGRDGFSAFSGSNQMNFYGGAICGNGRDGYFINQIASTCVLHDVAIHDNGGRGVRALRAEQPMVLNTAFNRNALSAIAFLGGTDDQKDVEAGIILGCLFGDNNPTGSDIELNRVQVVNIDNNYFFNVSETKPYHIRISGRSDGVFIRGSRWKNSAANVPAKVSTDGSPDVRYVLEDTGATGGVYNTSYVGVIHQYLMSFASSIVFQTRIDPGSVAPLFSIDASGKMSWGSGAAPTDVSISRTTAGSITVSGGIRVQSSMLAELASPPTAQAGFGRMYFDQTTQAFKAVLPSGAVRTFTVT